MATYGPGIDRSQHAKSVSHIITWNMPPITCISLSPKGSCLYGQAACSTVSHEIQALHDYFIQCLNIRKVYRNFRKRWKSFKTVFEEF